MGFWWFSTVCNIFIPILMMITGRLMWKRAPKSINWVLGYRTTRSMKNDDTWRFAHEYCGRIWWYVGLIMLIPSVLVNIPFYNGSEDTVGTVSSIVMLVQCAILIISIFPTEIALKKTFNDDGTRK